MPRIAPMVEPMNEDVKPITSAVREPQMMREKMSRPNASVPPQ